MRKVHDLTGFELLPESPVCCGYNPRAAEPRHAVATTREERATWAFDDLEAGIDPRDLEVWSRDREVFAKAVEWYENRPAAGETCGEQLFGCVATFCRTAKIRGWSRLQDSDRSAFELAASKLHRHGAR
jgi:hypothetical protein